MSIKNDIDKSINENLKHNFFEGINCFDRNTADIN